MGRIQRIWQTMMTASYCGAMMRSIALMVLLLAGVASAESSSATATASDLDQQRDGDYDQLPSEVAAALAPCDQQQLDSVSCAERVKAQYLASLGDAEGSSLQQGYLAEATFQAKLVAAQQQGISAAAVALREEASGFAQHAMNRYGKAGSTRAWVVLHALVPQLINQHQHDPEALANLLRQLDAFISELPSWAVHSRIRYTALTADLVSAQLNARVILESQQPNGNPWCQPGERDQVRQRYQDARQLAAAAQAWTLVANLWIGQANAFNHYCPNLATNDYADALAEASRVAREHRLDELAVRILLSQISVASVDAPGSPEVSSAHATLDEAEQLAAGQPGLKLQVLAARIRLALQLGQYPQVTGLSTQVMSLINSHPQQAAAALTPQEVASLFDNLAFSAFARGDINRAVALQQNLVTLRQRFASAAGMAALNHNLSLYQMLAGGDSKQAITTLTALSESDVGYGVDHIKALARHNLAAVSIQRGDLAAASSWLEPLAHAEQQPASDGTVSGGLYTYRLALLAALRGQHHRAQALLELSANGFAVSDDSIHNSQIALAQYLIDPAAVTLSLHGPLLDPQADETFGSRWFKRRIDSISEQAAHLVARPAGDVDHQPLPQLNIDIGHRGRVGAGVSAVAFSADGEQVVSCGQDGRCTLWDSSSGRTLRQIQAGSAAITAIAISPDVAQLVTHSGWESQLRLWDLDSGNAIASLQTDSNQGFGDFAFSADGRYLAALQDGWVFVWQPGQSLPFLARDGRGFDPLTAGSSASGLISGDRGDTLLLQFARGGQRADGTPGDPVTTAVFEWRIDADQLHQRDGWQTHDPLQLRRIGSDAWLIGSNQRRRLVDDEWQACQDSSCLLAGLEPFATALSALETPPRQAAISLDGQRAVIELDDALAVVNAERLVARHSAHSRRTMAHHWQPATQILRLITDSLDSSWNAEGALVEWDLKSGRVSRQQPISSNSQWQWLDDQLWQIDERTLIHHGDGSAEQTPRQFQLARHDDHYYPVIRALIAPPATEGDQRLWLLEDNNYSGAEKRYRLRRFDSHQPPTAEDQTATDEVMAWELKGQQLLAVDGQRQALLVRNDVGWGEAATARWLAFADGRELGQFALSGDWYQLNDAQTAILPSPRSASLAMWQGQQLQLRQLNGELLWQHQSPLGRIMAVAASADGNELAILIDAQRFSFIQRLDRSSGALLSSRLSDRHLHQISYLEGERSLLLQDSSGALLLWPLDARSALATLFHLDQDDWLVVGAQGHYDSNRPGDIGAVSWVVADAPRNALPLQSFMRDFYEPGLLGRLRSGEILAEPANLTSLNRALPRVSIVKVTPAGVGLVDVTIEVVRGYDHQQTSSGAYDLRLFRDGQLIGQRPQADGSLAGDGDLLGDQTQRQLTLRQIALPPDRNQVNFSAYAFNHDGVRSERSQFVYQPAAAPAANERIAYLLTIGVNDYQNPAWNLRYAANDAQAMQQQLTDALYHSGDYDQVVALPLISAVGIEPSQRATKTGLLTLLATLAAGDSGGEPSLRGLKPDLNDTLIISFSGHGYVHEDGRFYFLLEDIGAGTGRSIDDQLLKQALSSDELSLALRTIDVGRMVMIVDACHSAASIASSGFKPGPMGSRGLGQLAYDKAMLFLTASQAEQFALESDNLQHGFLSYALLREGLAASRADFAPTDGHLNAGEWLRYGAQRVPQLIFEMSAAPGNGASRGFKLSKPENNEQQQLEAIQKPYLFDFSQPQQPAIPLALPSSP